MARVKWIDLSSIGVHLGSYRSNGDAGLAMIDTTLEQKYKGAIEKLGFQPAQGQFTQGLYLKPGHSITPQQVREVFGNDAVNFFVEDSAKINSEFNKKLRDLTKMNANALFSQQRPLGLNHHGEVVFESPVGRFVIRKTQSGAQRVVKEGGDAPSVFLYAGNQKELNEVARGFVSRIVKRGESLKLENVTRLIQISNKNNFSNRDYQEAIESATNAAFLETASNSRVDIFASFDLANKIYDGLPNLNARTPNSIARQQYSTPLPIAALSQIVLAEPDGFSGKSVLEPTIGNGMLIAGAKANGAKVYGVEIDPDRVANAEAFADSVLLGDATDVDFRRAFNQLDGFDYVIANPPFGEMEKRKEVKLPPGSLVDSLVVQRLDHYILLKSLESRKENGRAVYVTGADSYIEDGEIRGRSRHLINYLYDHYEMEGVSDISGALYKKQGASFPIRFYVIGARRAKPLDLNPDTPAKMHIIRSYDELKNWTAQIIERRRSADLSALVEPIPVTIAVAERANIDLSFITTRLAETSPFDEQLGEHWIVMNAPRPLVGHKTRDGGEFLHGRFYAAIDLQDDYAKSYIETNLKLDGELVFVATREAQQQMALALLDPKYREFYSEPDSIAYLDLSKIQRLEYAKVLELAGQINLATTEYESTGDLDYKRMATVADEWGQTKFGYVATVDVRSQIDDNIILPPEVMKTMQDRFAMDGEAFVVLVNSDNDRPYSVYRVLSESSNQGMHGAWYETPQEAITKADSLRILEAFWSENEAQPDYPGFTQLSDGRYVSNRVVDLSKITNNGLARLLTSTELTFSDKALLKDYKWVLLYDKETAYDRGYYTQLLADAMAAEPKVGNYVRFRPHKSVEPGDGESSVVGILDEIRSVNNSVEYKILTSEPSIHRLGNVVRTVSSNEGMLDVLTYQGGRLVARAPEFPLVLTDLFALSNIDAKLQLAGDDPYNLTNNPLVVAEGKARRVLPDQLKNQLIKMSLVNERLNEKGIVSLSRQEFMRDVNSGNREGYSVTYLEKKLAEHRRDLDLVRSEKLHYRKVGGQRASKEGVLRWLEDEIRKAELALACDGYLCTVNIHNHLFALSERLRNGFDTAYRSDEQIAIDEKNRQADEIERDARDKALEEKANQSNNFEKGEKDLSRPIEISFTIQSHRTEVIASLREKGGAHQIYNYLNSLYETSAVSIKRSSLPFNQLVDVNLALKRGCEFSYCKVEPRKGYVLAKFKIDLASEPVQVKAQNFTESNDIGHSTVRTLGKDVDVDWTYLIADPDKTHAANLKIAYHAIASHVYRGEIPSNVMLAINELADTLRYGELDDISLEGGLERFKHIQNEIGNELKVAVTELRVEVEALLSNVGDYDEEKLFSLAQRYAFDRDNFAKGVTAGLLAFSSQVFLHDTVTSLATVVDEMQTVWEGIISKLVIAIDDKRKLKEALVERELLGQFSPFELDASRSLPESWIDEEGKVRPIVFAEGFDGWSDGALLELRRTPRSVRKLINSEGACLTKQVNAGSLLQLVERAGNANVALMPIASWHLNSLRQGDASVTRVEHVILTDQGKQHCVVIAERYVRYFYQNYDDVIFHIAPDATGGDESTVRVTSKAVDIGLVMPIRLPKEYDRLQVLQNALSQAPQIVNVDGTKGPNNKDFSNAPFDDYIVTKQRANNAVTLRPKPGRHWSTEQKKALIEWLKSNNWSATENGESIRAVGPLGAVAEDVPTPLSKKREQSMRAADLRAEKEFAYEQNERLHIEEAVSEPLAVEVKQSNEDNREETDYQQPYVATSNVSDADTMIPANLSGPVYEAMAKIKAKVGDIDTFVARELDFSVNELGRYFKAEQVDALAMIFAACDRHTGFLLADKMGVGKGRVLAGVARRERINGRIPMFITVSPSLFSDFLERDVASINSRDMFRKPLIVNDGARTVDSTGNVVARSLRRTEYKQFAESGELPIDTDIVLLTYSQLGREMNKNLTARYMNEICHRYPITMLLDESHNGAGASNTSANLDAMIDSIGLKGNVVYSSATAIKGAKNLRLYKKMLPAGLDHEELLLAVESDPLSLQEALNYEIASKGNLISRELSDFGIEKEYVISTTVERNRQIADQVAQIFSAMSYLSGDIKEIVDGMNKEMQDALADIPEEEREGERMGASSLNFSSRLHELNRQFLLAIKANDIVNESIKILANNEKPIITVQHTGESILADYVAKANEIYEGTTKLDARTDGRMTIIEHALSYKDVLHKYLEKITWIKVQGRYGDVSFKQANSEAVRNAIQYISGLVSQLPDDLPLTPIDYVREQLAKFGYSVGEVSGRNLRAVTLQDGRVSIESVPGKGDKTRINRVVREFNNGDCDVIVLTGAGSTGLSMQAAPSVGRDLRARVMLKWEMQPDIARERQIDGRHNRTGQVVLPKYKVMMSGLPADDRIAMMFNNKNRSLSSSTVANRDSNDIIREVPDLLNDVGDMAAEKLLKEFPDIAIKLQIDLPDEKDEGWNKGPLWFSSKLSGRASLLPVSEQEAMYELWQANFVEILDKLKSQGRNPLEVECWDIRARTVSRTHYMGDDATPGSESSSFEGAIFVTELAYDKTIRAMKASEIDEIIAQQADPTGLGLEDTRIKDVLQYLKENRMALLKEQTSKKYPTVESGLAADTDNDIKDAAKKIDWLARNLPRLKPGAVFLFEELNESVPHVVVDFGCPTKLDQFSKPSQFYVSVMCLGSEQTFRLTLSQLCSRDVELEARPFAELPLVRHAFDNAKDGVETKTIRVLDGNLFAAVSLNLREHVGKKIVYTDEHGARQHGIYLTMSEKKLEALPEKIRNVALVRAVIDKKGAITSDPSGKPDLAKTDVAIKLGGDGTYQLEVPLARCHGGHIYLDPVLSEITGKEAENKYNLEFSSKSNKMVASIGRDIIDSILTYLVGQLNVSFYVADREALRLLRETMKDKNHELGITQN